MSATIPDELRTLLLQPIHTIEAGKAFIEMLCKHDLNYHFEDGAEDMINYETDKRTFAKGDAKLVQARVDECYAVEGVWTDDEGGCPIGYQIEVLKRMGKWPEDE